MSRRQRPNIPNKIHLDDREVLGFYQAILDYQPYLIRTGTRINWRSTQTPSGGYLKLDGSVITNSLYPALIEYAAYDSTFTVGAITTTLPTEANTWIKT